MGPRSFLSGQRSCKPICGFACLGPQSGFFQRKSCMKHINSELLSLNQRRRPRACSLSLPTLLGSNLKTTGVEDTYAALIIMVYRVTLKAPTSSFKWLQRPRGPPFMLWVPYLPSSSCPGEAVVMGPWVLLAGLAMTEDVPRILGL